MDRKLRLSWVLFALAKYCPDSEGTGSWLLTGASSERGRRTQGKRTERAKTEPDQEAPPELGSAGNTHLARGYGPPAAAPALAGHGKKQSPRTTRRGQSPPSPGSACPSTEPLGTRSSVPVTPAGTRGTWKRPCLGLPGL